MGSDEAFPSIAGTRCVYFAVYFPAVPWHFGGGEVHLAEELISAYTAERLTKAFVHTRSGFGPSFKWGPVCWRKFYIFFGDLNTGADYMCVTHHSAPILVRGSAAPNTQNR